MMFGKTFFCALAVLALCLGSPGGSRSEEFSAQMVLKDRDQVIPGRLYVKNGKMRQEFLDASGHTVTIVRKDKRLVWILLPFDRTYQELPLGPRLPGQFLQIPFDARSKRKTGSEVMEGFETEKYECLVPGGPAGTLRQCYWLAPKLGLPVKMTCGEQQLSLEYRNIKEGPVADRLFEVPPGYRKISGPGGRSAP